MSTDTHIKRNKGDSADGNTDCERLKKMTEEEIEENAKADPDASILTDKELVEFKKVTQKRS
ncbi:MAG: hypothetical protein JKY01_14010 [Pseudomonadales bacterium]|nr:hypothetical protein [Pseudomonadales bacterium]